MTLHEILLAEQNALAQRHSEIKAKSEEIMQANKGLTYKGLTVEGREVYLTFLSNDSHFHAATLHKILLFKLL